jgi:TM2 domain-containing membrane protein YozV
MSADQSPRQGPLPPGGSSKRVPAGVTGILLGGLGVHKFILGYSSEGAIMLVVTIVGFFFFGIGPLVMWIIGFIEGVIYLTKSEATFNETYVQRKRGWF